MGVIFINPYRFAGFDPLSLSPALWLDASDTSTITASSGAVSQWNDKSGNGRNVSQGTAANQPTTGAVTQNGLNVLSFDGGDFMTGTNGVTGNVNLTVFAVAKITDGGTTRAIAFLGSTTTNNGLGFGYHRPSDTYTAFIWGAANESRQSSPTLGVFRQFAVTKIASGNLQLYINGVGQTAVASVTTNLSNSMQIGRAAASTLPFQGQLAELICYPSVLSAADMQQVDTYLNAKWAVY